MTALVTYDSSSPSSDDDSQRVKEATLPSRLLHSQLVPTVNVAPPVDHKDEFLSVIPVDPRTRELAHNPTYEQIYAPTYGPTNPFKSEKQLAPKNMLTGLVEEAHVNPFAFENQHRTFMSYGYAQDPSVEGGQDRQLVGEMENAELNKGKTVFEKAPKRKGDLRKRDSNWDPTSEDYTGPWAKYKDEVSVSVPSEEDRVYLEAYLSKKATKRRCVEEAPVEEKSTLHIPSAVDYQGRSFLHAPHDIPNVNLRSTEPVDRCFLPKKLIHEWNSAHARGVAAIRLFPKTGHLLLSAGMDSKVKLWELYKERRIVRSYMGHRQAVRDIDFDNTGEHFLSASYDRYVKLWDTETGKCTNQFNLKRVAYCVRFNPDEDKQHLFLAGCADKKILCVGKYLICQSLDNQLVVFNIFAGFKRMRKKIFRGHMVSGYACTVDMSPDQRYIISGDGDGNLCLWEWKSTRLLTKWKAHEGVCINSAWLPHETSKVVTAGWDGNIKLWD
ncbi:Pre mrna splicing factor pre mrna processing fac tor [Fasciola hepatica]|uniref:Pre mrna splicing factor pre mrna processing fac tor n=1 Tax=Fasciola hepatica TaxID=6192 RepID=A0A4E0RG54_FASHE|nr:Pre mrna splicing factor pre mrna processing fac tor [Fasciola hepatica]